MTTTMNFNLSPTLQGTWETGGAQNGVQPSSSPKILPQPGT